MAWGREAWDGFLVWGVAHRHVTELLAEPRRDLSVLGAPAADLRPAPAADQQQQQQQPEYFRLIEWPAPGLVPSPLHEPHLIIDIYQL